MEQDVTANEDQTAAAKIAALKRVRLATALDEDELMALCRRLHDENGLMAMSDTRVREMLHRAFDRQGGIIGVIGDPGKIEGAIALTISQMWYTDEWMLEELFSHVLPEHRRSTNAKDLITFAKNCADSIGLPLAIGVLSNERTEAKLRLYQRQLSKPSGAVFIYGRQTPTRLSPRAT